MSKTNNQEGTTKMLDTITYMSTGAGKAHTNARCASGRRNAGMAVPRLADSTTLDACGKCSAKGFTPATLKAITEAWQHTASQGMSRGGWADYCTSQATQMMEGWMASLEG